MASKKMYRLLNEGEILLATDEYYWVSSWSPTSKKDIGKNLSIGMPPYRRDFNPVEPQYRLNSQFMIKPINAIAVEIHQRNVDAGWWSNLDNGRPLDRNDYELIALMHSELSEAVEGLRKDQMDDHLPDRKMVEVEMADCVIRIMDYCGARKLDLGGAMADKLEYNKQRLDHKLENRVKDGGKKA